MLYKSLGFVKVEKVKKPTILFDRKPGVSCAAWKAVGWLGLLWIIILSALFGLEMFVRALWP